ncbi:hypothetical protein [Streptomyces syringium]|uniref:hypothetical protein n=1 Tax=Streptomyces syringium TaxID=76729 RepID=UPI003F554C17
MAERGDRVIVLVRPLSRHRCPAGPHLSVSAGDLADGKAVSTAVRNAEAARAVSDTAFAAGAVTSPSAHSNASARSNSSPPRAVRQSNRSSRKRDAFANASPGPAAGSRLTFTAFVSIGAPWSEHMIRRRPSQPPPNAQVSGLVRGSFRIIDRLRPHDARLTLSVILSGGGQVPRVRQDFDRGIPCWSR